MTKQSRPSLDHLDETARRDRGEPHEEADLCQGRHRGRTVLREARDPLESAA